MRVRAVKRTGSGKFRSGLGINYYVFYAARLTSLAGSLVSSVALPILVLQGTDNEFLSSAITAAATIPYLLFGLVAGAVADRVSSKRMMVSAHIVSGIAVATIPIANLRQEVHPAHALIVTFICGSSFVWFDAACFGLIPRLVPRAQLVHANSLLQSTGYVVESVVPVLAGFSIAALGAANAVSLEAALLLVAILILSRLREEPDRPVTDLLTDNSLGSEIREGVDFIFRHPVIRAFTLIGFASSFVNGVVVGLFAVIARDYLLFGVNDPRTGLIWAALSVGSVFGALMLPFLRKLLSMGYVTLFALSVYPVVICVLVFWDTSVARLCAIALWGLCVSLVVLNGIVSRQELTDAHMQARVNTTGRMFAYGGTPFGAIFGGVVASKCGLSTALLTVGAATIVITSLAWCSALAKGGTRDD